MKVIFSNCNAYIQKIGTFDSIVVKSIMGHFVCTVKGSGLYDPEVDP